MRVFTLLSAKVWEAYKNCTLCYAGIFKHEEFGGLLGRYLLGSQRTIGRAKRHLPKCQSNLGGGVKLWTKQEHRRIEPRGKGYTGLLEWNS